MFLFLVGFSSPHIIMMADQGCLRSPTSHDDTSSYSSLYGSSRHWSIVLLILLRVPRSAVLLLGLAEVLDRRALKGRSGGLHDGGRAGEGRDVDDRVGLGGTRGDELWEAIMAAGKPFGLKPGHTSSIRRIEGGMLSYHADADIHTNPFELGFDRLIDLDMDAEFVGKDALKRIKAEGVSRRQVGLVIDCPALSGPNTNFWPVTHDGAPVGKVTSAIHSPRLDQNIALAMVAAPLAEIGTMMEVSLPQGSFSAKVVERPFCDPKKKIAST